MKPLKRPASPLLKKVCLPAQPGRGCDEQRVNFSRPGFRQPYRGAMGQAVAGPHDEIVGAGGGIARGRRTRLRSIAAMLARTPCGVDMPRPTAVGAAEESRSLIACRRGKWSVTGEARCPPTPPGQPQACR